MKCKKCGVELEVAVKFCPQCGEKVKLYCTECGGELAAGARFCPSCGKPVTDNVNEFQMNEVIAECGEDKLARDTYRKEDETNESVKRGNMVLDVQSNGESKFIAPNTYSLKQETEEESFTPRSKENFLEELNQLAGKDKDSKRVLDFYGTKILAKHLYPYLDQKEKIVALRHIVHHNFASMMTRNGSFFVKEFLVLTNERVIKFVKSYWLKPKIRSCYLSEISSIEAANPGNALKGVFLGESLRVHTSEKVIKIHTFGKGSAKRIKEEILQAISGANETGINRVRQSENEIIFRKKSGSRLKKTFIIGAAICISVTAVILFALKGDSGIEISECLTLANTDTVEWILKNGLAKEEDDILYTKDGLSIMLDDNSNVYMIGLEQPGYSLYGLEVGKEYSREKDNDNLDKAGYVLVEEEEDTASYEAVKGKKNAKSDGLIILELDNNECITNIIYFKDSMQGMLGETEMEIEEPLTKSTSEAKTNPAEKKPMGIIEKILDTVDIGEKLTPYEGTWWDLNSQRCYMEIVESGDILHITVHWSSGAFDDTEWAMTGTYDDKSDKVRFNDCTLKYIHYDDNGSSTEDIQYTNGTGSIYIANDGYLYWEDNEQQAGGSCYFEKETDSMETETLSLNTDVVSSLNANWTGTYIAEDDQAITVSSADDSSVALTFVGYSEEGWQTRTEVLSYRNAEKTQVSDPYYYDGSLVQETVYTITETGIQVETLPSGGWADGFYLRQ